MMKKKVFSLIAISSVLLASCDYPITSSTSMDNNNVISSSENKETDNSKESKSSSKETSSISKESNSTSEVTSDTKGENSSVSSSSQKQQLLNCGAYEEGMFVYWEGAINNLVKVEYAKADDRKFIEIDKELIRVTDNNLIRADVVGVSEGDYILRVTKDNGIILESDILNVGSYDRSGYAHFKCEKDNTGINVSEGIGA
jgi:DNA mismatch repair ATPase MutL